MKKNPIPTIQMMRDVPMRCHKTAKSGNIDIPLKNSPWIGNTNGNKAKM